MLTYKTTAKELWVFINPAMQELRGQRVRGKVALDVARNIQIVRLAIEPIETVRQRIQEEMQQIESDKELTILQKQQQSAALGKEFDEMLTREMEIGYWPLPYAEVQKTLDECSVGVTEALMFMLVTEGKKDE